MILNKNIAIDSRQFRNFPLDFIRCLSILFIIFFHFNCDLAQFVSPEKVMWKNYGYASNFGVSFFFILSGASLMLSTQNNYSVINFYKKRFLSIYPLFWLTYILVAIFYIIFSPANFFYGKSIGSLILTIIGLDGFLLYKIPNYYLIGEWFLGCIVIIYLIFPAVRYAYGVNKHLFTVFLLAFTFFLEKIYGFDMPIERFPLFRLFEFVAGMYIVDIYKDYLCGKRNCIPFAAAIFSVLGFLSILHFGSMGSMFVAIELNGIFIFILLFSMISIFEKYLRFNVIFIISRYSFAAFLVHHVLSTNLVNGARLLLDNFLYQSMFFLLLLLLIFILSALIDNFKMFIVKIFF